MWTNYADIRLHQRLMHVLRQRYGHRIAYEVEQAKIRCSQSDAEATMDLSYVEADLAAPMTVNGMQEHLAALLARTVACARECVQRPASRRQRAGRRLPHRRLLGPAAVPARLAGGVCRRAAGGGRPVWRRGVGAGVQPALNGAGRLVLKTGRDVLYMEAQGTEFSILGRLLVRCMKSGSGARLVTP